MDLHFADRAQLDVVRFKGMAEIGSIWRRETLLSRRSVDCHCLRSARESHAVPVVAGAFHSYCPLVVQCILHPKRPVIDPKQQARKDKVEVRACVYAGEHQHKHGEDDMDVVEGVVAVPPEDGQCSDEHDRDQDYASHGS